MSFSRKVATIIPRCENLPDLGNFVANTANLLPRLGFVRRFEQSMNSQVDALQFSDRCSEIVMSECFGVMLSFTD